MIDNDLQKLLDELIQTSKECEWIEFKENNSDIELIGKYLSAISNGACLNNQSFGYLVYGVTDDTHTIIGTKFNPLKAKKGNEEIENWLLQKLNPRIDFRIHFFQYHGKDIAIFKIPATLNIPVKFENIAYIRVGSYTKKLSDFPEKERNIWKNTENTEFEKGLAIQNIMEEKIFELLDYPRYFELLKLQPPLNKEIILQKFEEEKFIIKKFQSYDITNLGAILFAKDLDRFEKLGRKAIRTILYNGKNRLKTVKEHANNKGYAIDFATVIDYIDDQLPTNEEIGKAYREQIKVYPKLAIRELVANAIIHQDFYASGTSVTIEIFEDRIEISNPGKPLIETQRFIDHKPQSRNEKLAYFMRRINICEERGSGIDKVINECEVHQLPAPNFLDNGNYTNVILYAPKTLRQLDLTDKIRACYQHCSLKYVSGEFMTNQTLRERFAIDEKNYSTVSRIIGATKNENLIKEYNPENKANKYTKYLPYWA